jgi:L-threonylcarbamoyladenylate synthase
MLESIWQDENLIRILKQGGVVIMPTDTLYGIVGQAENVSTVERIYQIRKRDSGKKCITLIGDIKELEKFSIALSEKQKKLIEKYWPGPNSIIIEELAFRVPASLTLRNLLLQVGPLIAPSANLQGMPPAKNINEAKNYFGNMVDLYVDGGTIEGQASKLIKLEKNDSITIIRK